MGCGTAEQPCSLRRTPSLRSRPRDSMGLLSPMLPQHGRRRRNAGCATPLREAVEDHGPDHLVLRSCSNACDSRQGPVRCASVRSANSMPHVASTRWQRTALRRMPASNTPRRRPPRKRSHFARCHLHLHDGWYRSGIDADVRSETQRNEIGNGDAVEELDERSTPAHHEIVSSSNLLVEHIVE